MSLQVGLGTISCQVAADGGLSVAETYEDALALAVLAERLGFDSLWVSTHHGAANAHLPSPLVMLAAVAARTERIGLGTALVLAPFQHPLRFAEDCAVLDQLARGRLTVCLGNGWRRQEFEAFGIPIRERVGRTVELLEICRAAWRPGRFSYQGRYFSCDDVLITPKPFGPLKLLLGGSGPRAIERAGWLADGFIGPPQQRVHDMLQAVKLLDAAARAAGRDPEQLTIGFQLNCWVSADGQLSDPVRLAMWRQMSNSIAWHAGSADGQLGPPPIDEAELRGRVVAGAPATVVQRVRPWLEAFGERDLRILFRLHYPGLPRAEAESALRLFAAEVVPALRRIADGARPHAAADATSGQGARH